MQNYFTQNKELLTSLIVAFLCFILSLKFPSQNVAQKITASLFFLVALPAIYIKFILKKNLSDFGLNLGDKKTGILGVIAVFLASTLSAYLMLRFFPDGNTHELPNYVIENFRWFLFYELVFVNLYIFASEFFFRGFLLPILSPKLGYWAIMIQAIAYVSLLAFSQNSPAQLVSEFFLAAIAGTVAAKSKSFIFAYFAAFLFTILFDAYLIYTLK